MGVSQFFIASLPSFLFSCICYSVWAPHFGEPKQRSWIITFVASTVMSLCSLPFVRDFILSGGDILAIRYRPRLATAVCGSFHGFLLSDLVIGLISYPRHLAPLVGWTHHLSYMLISHHVAQRGWGHVFCTCLFMEIPTWLLESSFLWPKLRNDIICATAYFSTRIVLHGVLLVEAALPSPRNKAFGGSFTPALLLTAAFLMHVSWLISSVKAIIRRSKARSQPKPVIQGSKGSAMSTPKSSSPEIGTIFVFTAN